MYDGGAASQTKKKSKSNANLGAEVFAKGSKIRCNLLKEIVVSCGNIRNVLDWNDKNVLRNQWSFVHCQV